MNNGVAPAGNVTTTVWLPPVQLSVTPEYEPGAAEHDDANVGHGVAPMAACQAVFIPVHEAPPVEATEVNAVHALPLDGESTLNA